MIYLIVGGSRAGKSTITTNTFIKDSKLVEYKDLTWVTENDDYYFIGRYIVDGRRKGTDLIARQEIPLFYDQIINLMSLGKNKDIVLEGDKMTSDVFFSKLKNSGLDCKLYWIQCTPETSIGRCRDNNDNVNDSNLKACCTRAKNRYDKWGEYFNGEIINTDNVTDFTKLKINL